MHNTLESAPVVSVIIPCYNGARFIGRAIESALGQSFRRLEVIVVDDGSTDSSGTIIGGYLRDRRLKSLAQGSNRGIPSARNAGIGLSSGSYIAFLDQDDYWKPEKIERQIRVFESDTASDLGLVFSDIEIVDETSGAALSNSARVPDGFNALSRRDMLRALYLDNFIPIVSALVRRECFDSLGLLDERIRGGGDDYEFCLRLLSKYRARFVDEVLTVRAVHEDNYTNTERMLPEVLGIIDAFAEGTPELTRLRNRRAGDLLFRLGWYYMICGDSTRAREACVESLKLRPLNLKSALGVLFASLGAPGRAAVKWWYSLKK